MTFFAICFLEVIFSAMTLVKKTYLNVRRLDMHVMQKKKKKENLLPLIAEFNQLSEHGSLLLFRI